MKVRQSSMTSMLPLIQSTEYYPRTTFGKSTTYSGGNEDPKQGSYQGNTAAPPIWQWISSLPTNTKKHTGHGMTVILSITKKTHSQVGIVLVDGIQFWKGLGEGDDVIPTPQKGQRSMNSRDSNILVVGRKLRTNKCFYTVHTMKPKDNEE